MSEKIRDMETVLKKGEEIRASLLKCVTDVQWTWDKESDGIRIFSRTYENHNIFAFRAICEVPIPALEFYNLCKGIDNLRDLDTHVAQYHYCHQIDENTDIFYAQYNPGIIFVSNRDFVVLESRERLNTGTYIISNVSYDDYADSKATKASYDGSCVRGTVLCSGWLIKPLDDHKCLVDFTCQVDPGGWLPTFSFHEPKIIHKVRDLYLKNIQKLTSK